VQTPGILHRLSFFIILNSLVIFAVVLIVSMENNQAKIDRLINYKFSFISKYLRAEFGRSELADGSSEAGHDISAAALEKVFEQAGKSISGLGSVALLHREKPESEYTLLASTHRDSLTPHVDAISKHLVEELDPDLLQVSGTLVGRTFTAGDESYKTIYVPRHRSDYSLIMAVTFIPSEIVGTDAAYNWTIIVLFLVITLISLLLINLIARKFVTPLQHLVQGMEKTALGEVLYKIEDVADHEIGRVTTAFNTMSAELWEQRGKLTTTLEELSRANTSLAESKAFLSKLIENSPFGVIATTTDHKIRVFSKAAGELFDMGTDTALESEMRDLFPYMPEKLFSEDLSREGMYQEEMICRKSGGETFPALVTRVTIRDRHDQAGAYLFIIRDISESAGFQEMMISIDRMATRGVMAGEIAHEINNYLAVILGNVELIPMMLAKGKMDKVDRKLEVLRETVGRIQRFSEGLMGYGNEDAVRRPNDLNQMIENLVAFLRPQNRYDDIKFRMCLSPKLPLVAFDSSQLQQMLVNLLNNAADALRERDGQRNIDIITRLDDSGEFAQVIIEDNAGGLPDDLPDVIFEKRYTGKRRGRGFGLVIVKRIIDKHNGRVDYESRPGDGASFVITLPRRVQEPSKSDTMPVPTSQVTT
jgi:PAS domain S-box-containing protein